MTLHHQHQQTLTGLSQGKHYYFATPVAECTSPNQPKPGSSSRNAEGSAHRHAKRQKPAKLALSLAFLNEYLYISSCHYRT